MKKISVINYENDLNRAFAWHVPAGSRIERELHRSLSFQNGHVPLMTWRNLHVCVCRAYLHVTYSALPCLPKHAELCRYKLEFQILPASGSKNY